jgi:hypothetical protein
MSAPGADAAQSNGGTAPDGQGQDQDRSAQQYSVLGEDAFNDAPEELRDHLVNYVKTKVDPALTQRFQEASEFRSTWEPFSQIEGLTDLHPEDVDQLVELGYTMAAAMDENHPQRDEAIQQLRETWEQMAEQFGFGDEDESDEGGEDDGDELEYMTREEFEAELEAREQQRTQESQREQTVEQIRQEMRSAIDDLPLGDGEKREKAEAAIFSFMGRYDDPNMTTQDVVKAAYGDYTDLVGGAQEDLVEDTEGRTTGSTLRGGGADTSPEEIHGWADADKAAKARLMGAQR